MSIQRIVLYVEGMTCSSCESRIAKALASLSGITWSKANLQGGTAEVEYDDAKITVDEIKAAIGKTGYTVRDSKGSGTAIALGIGLLLVAAYLIAGSRGLFAYIPRIDASIGYGMLFAIGILTSIHCVAMCGGIALSQSLDTAQVPCAAQANSSPKKNSGAVRFVQILPALKYNAGRVIAYTIIGGIVGAAGSVFGFSPMVKGIIAGLAGLLMIVLALRMLGLFRALPSSQRIVPKPLRDVSAKITAALRKGGPFGIGLLNGLMPCGPLQTMQLYALGTGSAHGGALSMLIFSLGTVPLLFLFGITATLLPRKVVPMMVKASAVLVMFLGVVTFARAASLSGISLPFGRNQSIVQTTGLQSATVANGFQSIVTEFKNGRYIPFAVKAGVPLKWTIRIAEEDITGCNGTVIVPAYGIKKDLVPGDNLIEFTPSKAGTIAYSCWMGMIRSSITVVGDNTPSSGAAFSASPTPAPDIGSGAQRATCSCCSGL